jgi:hypothetical protein
MPKLGFRTVGVSQKGKQAGVQIDPVPHCLMEA